ncbi:MAG: hypothetical protein KA117_03830 [Verrucomicrobia bacterium]|nr:hypothetical protein [Verrucomicrobiota bacterium]MBP8014408.1 hypothetical protein [Verrucomicrobiota bacterium]NLH86517.1 hypothetical protein [Verrucomicrobiota bacterium]
MAGREILSVEGVAAGSRLHPVQEQMVRRHGSQCGYCTPGFVMSLFEGYYRGDIRQAGQLDDQLSAISAAAPAAARFARPPERLSGRGASPPGGMASPAGCGSRCRPWGKSNMRRAGKGSSGPQPWPACSTRWRASPRPGWWPGPRSWGSTSPSATGDSPPWSRSRPCRNCGRSSARKRSGALAPRPPSRRSRS